MYPNLDNKCVNQDDTYLNVSKTFLVLQRNQAKTLNPAPPKEHLEVRDLQCLLKGSMVVPDPRRSTSPCYLITAEKPGWLCEKPGWSVETRPTRGWFWWVQPLKCRVSGFNRKTRWYAIWRKSKFLSLCSVVFGGGWTQTGTQLKLGW